MILLAPVTKSVFLDIMVTPVWFCPCNSKFLSLLHRCTKASLVQPFSNLILKGYGSVACSCPVFHVPCLSKWCFSELEDSNVASLLFRSLMFTSGIPQKIKSSLYLHFTFVINLLLCYKFHVLFGSEMHWATVNEILFVFS